MSTQTPALPRTDTAGRGLAKNAAVTAAVATIGNLAIWANTSAAVDVPDRFTPLQPGSVVFMTILGVILAAVAYRVLAGRSATPAATFRKIVPIALVASFVPDIMIWASAGYDGAAKAETVLPLMAMHVLAGAAVYALLPKKDRAER
ncbi:MAG TPA: DUF6069 family protein [Naasia sp.]|jgi:hypothetical protein